MKIIYGLKGTGKTKTIIDSANDMVSKAKGNVVYITDTNRYSIEIKHPIRFVDVAKFQIVGKDGLRGFIKGIVAANGDNEYIYIDGVARIAKAELQDLQDIFETIEMLEKEFGVKFVLTVSSAKEDLPDFVLKHVD